MSSVGSEAGSEGSSTSRNGEIVITGYLKKLKTMKKKFFVLRADSQNLPASLEYYDSGKKWKNNQPPKRNIILKNCLSINRRTDTKYKYVIALFSGADCFGVVFECEDDIQEWLRLLLIHHQGEDTTDSHYPKPYYEHVWRVTIQKKELAGKHNLSGVFLLCLTDSTLSLVKHVVDGEQESKFYEFSLQSIRRCGNLDAFFYMELGQASCLGAGNLWMQADDSIVAQNMHSVIMNACTSCPKKEMAPKSRSRSSSANEASKPVYFGRKWPSSGDDTLSAVLSYTKSQSHQDHTVNSSNSIGHSVSSVGDGMHHHHHNLASVPFSPYPPIRRASTGTRPVTTGPALLSSGRIINASYTGRERCDSLPTRPRVTLDVSRNGSNAPYLTSVNNRPHSMYNRSIFSPTGLSHPTSPMSTTYSNDSAGSSLSVDADCENWSEIDNIRKIIEETPNEYVQWGAANQSRNFLIENIPHSNNVCRNMKPMFPPSNSNSQSSCSPCSSSPMDAGAYIPMSPPESVAEKRNRTQLNRSYDSMNHSRESSIHEDVAEGYVPMAPLSVDAGYISMDHSGRKQGDLSSGLSSCSITSGTPSTDVRFSEFQLDKVSSYFTPSDEDIVFNVRQTRAYSTGSKPDTLHSKFVRCDSADGLRVRAFSLGSRCPKNSLNMPPTPRRTTPASTSTSSIEPCDDLMEIDFSANKLRNRQIRSRIKHHQRHPQKSGIELSLGALAAVTNNSFSYPLVTDGYMDMSPKSSPKVESCNESRISCASDASNMSPPRLSKHLLGRTSQSNTVNFSKQAFAKGSPSSGSSMLEKVLEMESVANARRSSDDDYSYMDMKPGVCDMPDGAPRSDDSLIATTPVLVATATTTVPSLFQRKDSFSLVDSVASRTAGISCSTPLPTTPCPANVPHIKQPLLDTNGKQLKKVDAKTAVGSDKCSTPDGYVDMTFKGRSAKAVAASTPELQTTKMVARIPEKTPDGYVDMSFKDVHSRKNLVDSNSISVKNKAQQQQPHLLLENKMPACCSGKENQQMGGVVVEMQQQQTPPQPLQRQSSKPIAIQQAKGKRSGSGGGFFRRKLSGDETPTSKPNFLLPFASLGRKKKVGGGHQKKPEKAGNNGLATAVESPVATNAGATIFPLSPDRSCCGSSALASPSLSTSLDYDPNSKCAITACGQSVRLTCDAEIRSLERVSWDRGGGSTCGGDDEEAETGDYMVMTPGVGHELERKVAQPACLRRSFSGRGAEEAAAEGGDVGVRTLQRCISVPTTMAGTVHSWIRCTSVPEVGKHDAVADAKCRSEDGSKPEDIRATSGVGSVAGCGVDDRLCHQVKADTSLPQVTRNYTDVPKTCASSNAHIPHRDKVMYATLDIPPSNESLPKSDSVDSAKSTHQSSLTYAQIDFEKPSSSSSSPSK